MQHADYYKCNQRYSGLYQRRLWPAGRVLINAGQDATARFEDADADRPLDHGQGGQSTGCPLPHRSTDTNRDGQF